MSRMSRDQKRRKKLAERERRQRLCSSRREEWFLSETELSRAASSLRLPGDATVPAPSSPTKSRLTAMTAVATDFAAQMGCEAPRPVERLPESGCQVADCHANVQKKVHFHGGRAVWGWHFTLNSADPNQGRVDAVFHAVWEAPQGDLINITPQSQRVIAGRKAGVFMPLPFFCEDKRYVQEVTVEDVGNGLLLFRTARQVFPQQEACALRLAAATAA
jgi:hypothetical protein